MDEKDQVPEATKGARPRIGFYIHLAAFVVVNALLIVINLVASPDQLWFPWPVLGWGLGLLLHAGLIRFLPKRPGGNQRRIASELRTKGRRKQRSPAR